MHEGDDLVGSTGVYNRYDYFRVGTFSWKTTNGINNHFLFQQYSTSLLIVRNKSPNSGKSPCHFSRLNKSGCVACTLPYDCPFAQETVGVECKFNFSPTRGLKPHVFQTEQIGQPLQIPSCRSLGVLSKHLQGMQRQRIQISAGSNLLPGASLILVSFVFENISSVLKIFIDKIFIDKLAQMISS